MEDILECLWPNPGFRSISGGLCWTNTSNEPSDILCCKTEPGESLQVPVYMEKQWLQISIDYKGPMWNGNFQPYYLTTVVDYYTKFVAARGIRHPFDTLDTCFACLLVMHYIQKNKLRCYYLCVTDSLYKYYLFLLIHCMILEKCQMKAQNFIFHIFAHCFYSHWSLLENQIFYKMLYFVITCDHRLVCVICNIVYRILNLRTLSIEIVYLLGF